MLLWIIPGLLMASGTSQASQVTASSSITWREGNRGLTLAPAASPK